MTSGTDPPFYVCCEFFIDNLQQFQGSLAERIQHFFKAMLPDIPFVLSPMHSPQNAKQHIHGIFDVTFADYKDIEYYINLFSAYKLPRPEFARNIYAAELYLTHDTVQSRLEDKQTFSQAERDTMVFGCGYKFHKLTSRASDDERAKCIKYITEKLFDVLSNYDSCSLVGLINTVRSPSFYADLDTLFSLDMCISKGINEVKTHFRFYKQYFSDSKSDDINNIDDTVLEVKLCDSIITGLVKSGNDYKLLQLHWAVYSNFPPYRDFWKNNFSSYGQPSDFLRSAVNYFSVTPEKIKRIHKIFNDFILESR